jgi:6-phosphogluconolactonase (cycloisomerase 2 family)
MRFSLTKLLQGLLCTTPVLVLALAACGGGGGSNATLASAYTLSVAVSGVSGTGLTLRNGQDTLSAASAVSYSFPTKVLAGSTYNITVPTQPTGPNQLCTVTNPSAAMPAYDLSVAVNCVAANTVGGNITFSGGATALGTGLILRNNGGDDLLVPANSTSFVFKTPLINNPASDAYTVTVAASPQNPGQAETCDVTAYGTGAISGDVNNVTINCVNSATLGTDPYVYTADYGDNTVSYYVADAGGALSAPNPKTAGNQPRAIAVDPAGAHAYAVNYGANNVSVYNVASGVLSPSTQSIATANGPRAIAIDPADKFAYVANFLSNTVSAYTISASDGKLTQTDADDVHGGVQYSISAKVGPNSIAIDPLGKYLYVANNGASGSTGSISVYSINTASGALTPIDADGAGASTDTFVTAGYNTSSVTIDPDGKMLYVTNSGSGLGNNSISQFFINSDGSLTSDFGQSLLYSPSFITIYPGGGYAYVGDITNDQISVYSLNADGSVNAPIQTIPTTGYQPLSMKIDSTGQNAYVANSGSSDGTLGISAYTINIANGQLTAVSGSPFTSGKYPFSITTSR